MPPEEIEATLLVQSEAPEDLTAEISQLEKIGSWRVQKQPSLAIHDRYFDTADARLQQQRLSLRFRQINHESKLTLKGGGEETDWGALRRTEIESPWSLEALRNVLREIEGFESADITGLPESDPVAALQKLGLKIIQERKTDRTVRNILGSHDTLLAELALDRVTYQFGQRQILHHEIEVEARGGNVDAVRKIVESLKSLDDMKLRPWAYSKLATGKAIEELISSQAFDLTGPGLSPELYDKVEEYLKTYK